MSHSIIETVNNLVWLATDPAALATSEAENAGRKLAKLIKENDLLESTGEASLRESTPAEFDPDLFSRCKRLEAERNYRRDYAKSYEDAERQRRNGRAA